MDVREIDLKAVDRLLGVRLRNLRLSRRMRQKHLADAIGMSAQQLQKYECGANGFKVPRLYQFCLVLKVSPLAFLEGLPLIEEAGDMPDDTRRMLRMMDAYRTLPDAVQKGLLALVRSMANQTVSRLRPRNGLDGLLPHLKPLKRLSGQIFGLNGPVLVFRLNRHHIR